jgi:N-sulfoglucosamine sulfohydrolase
LHTGVLANCDASATKEMLVESGWAEQIVPEEQLYDLIFDPNEADDLSGNPAHSATLADLRARLDRWMEETDDPLRHGPIEPPLGAVTNDPWQHSPNDPLKVTESAVAGSG